MPRDRPLVELCEVSKSFGPIRSLDRVGLEIHGGEVHVLAGGNGAGKSTLIKVLSGVFEHYEGEVLVEGVVRRLHRPEAARRAGIATIHQELPLVGSLSVADNLFLGEEGPFLAPIGRRREQARARELLAAVGLSVEPARRVETLTLAERQLVEIARALGRKARVVVFDEPTSALGEAEAARLFARIRGLRAAGAGVLYISHRMEEIYELGDRITVLRDGRVVESRPARELDERALIVAMTGRTLVEIRREPARVAPRAPLLEVENLSGARSGRPRFGPVTFSLGAGEILGLAGLAGSGAGELLQALHGDLPGRSEGRMLLDGRPFAPREPRSALERGVVLLPSDRRLSVFAELGMLENGTLSSLPRFSPRGVVRRAAERAAALPVFARLRLPEANPRRRARELSGGNRQRLALARCLIARPRVLLLDEPTRGVDVAVKQDIYVLLHELAAAGLGIVWIASELDELIAQSDRILVLSRGRIAAEFAGGAVGREELAAAAMKVPEVA